jgi:hypothetical protein
MITFNPRSDNMEACDIDFAAFDKPFSADVAAQIDQKFKADPAYLRDEFIIPKKADLISSRARSGTAKSPPVMEHC